MKRLRFGSGWALLGVALSAAAIHLVRPRAARGYSTLTQSSDFYVLPAPEQLVAISLGYRSALADLLFGRTLVAAGVHFSEKRVFESLDRYLDAVATLDPGYRDVYYYADPLLTLSTVVMPARNYRIARDFQERGRKLFPDDAELWMSSGQFVTYLAPPHLPPEEDASEWRIAGARIIEHACSVWPDPSDLPAGCMSVSTILSRAGEVEASINALHRLIALAEDPHVKASALARLEQLSNARQTEELRAQVGALASLNRSDLPLASLTAYQIMGPPFDFRTCAGGGELRARRCATSFRAWAEGAQLAP